MRMAWKAAAAAAAFLAFGAQAHEYKLGDLTIENPWARPTAGESKLGAAYLTVKNASQQADTLEAVSSPDAEKVQIHEHIHDANGVMHMQPVEGGLTIPAGGSVELKPGGFHLMLIGLNHNLEEGQRLPLRLSFAQAGAVDVEVKIEKKPDADSGMHEHHH